MRPLHRSFSDTCRATAEKLGLSDWLEKGPPSLTELIESAFGTYERYLQVAPKEPVWFRRAYGARRFLKTVNFERENEVRHALEALPVVCKQRIGNKFESFFKAPTEQSRVDPLTWDVHDLVRELSAEYPEDRVSAAVLGIAVACIQVQEDEQAKKSRGVPAVAKPTPRWRESDSPE